MKFTVSLLFALCYVTIGVTNAAPAPQQKDQDVQLLKFENNIEGESYNFAYEQSDQQKRAETGTFEPGPEPDQGLLKVVGDYSFQLPDGRTVTVTYTADDKGYRPKVSIS